MMPTQMLQKLVQEKYRTLGFDKAGRFVGEDRFRDKLINYYGGTKDAQALEQKAWKENVAEIRRLVQAKAYLPTATSSPPSNSKTKSNGSTAKPQTSSKATSSSTAAKTQVDTRTSTAKPQTSSKAAGSSTTAKTQLHPSDPKIDTKTSTAKPQTSSKATSSNATAKTPLHPSNPKVDIKTSTTKPQTSSKAISSSTTAKTQVDTRSLTVKPQTSSKATSSSTTAKPPLHPSDPKVDTRTSTAGNSITKVGAQLPNPKANASSHNQVPLNTKMLELVEDTRRLLGVNGHSESDCNPRIPDLEHQKCLLDLSSYGENSDLPGLDDSDIRDAVIFSTEALKRHDSRLLPQYGLLGSICPTKESLKDPRLFLNTNVPFSAFICGLQGSGKSHTISCLLENCLIKAPILGVLQQPLSALVLHFSQYTSRSSFQPCEAAFLAYHHPNFREYTGVSSIHVMVSPSNYYDLNTSYSYIPGVDVRPFKLKTKYLNVSSMLTLMSVDQTEAPPLYIGQITRILREIATTTAGEFSYPKFKEAIEACNLTPAQKAPLQQRLDLLESFLDLDDSAADYSFEAGSITIVDLSCPFVDTNTACVLFNICIGIYLESNPTVGKVIAVDEAHKYMTNIPAAKALTERLLTVIRLQRHYGARVIISTQEPTISPRLIDLCSIIVIHRFSSPEWFDVIRKHVSIAETDRVGLENLFGRIVTLRTGEALLFAPSKILTKREGNEDVFVQLSSNLLKVKIRKRLTWDGGKSVLVCKPAVDS